MEEGVEISEGFELVLFASPRGLRCGLSAVPVAY